MAKVMRAAFVLLIAAGALAGDKPPEGAIILFDGKHADQWKTDSHWKVVDGALIVDPTEQHRGCRIATRQSFTDFRLHVEFWLPLMADKEGQARANSGVFLAGRYEVQILDSYGRPPEANGAGALYRVRAPMVNASKPPEQWQSYDIEFRAPRLKGDQVITKPHVTVLHNNITIHDNVALDILATPNGKFDNYAPNGPILLQNHRCAVGFRNIWLVPR